MISQPRCLALTNLDFEYELAEGGQAKARGSQALMEGRWQSILRLLPQAREAVALEPSVLGKSGPPGSARRPGTIPSRGTEVLPPGGTSLPGWSGVERLVVWGVTPKTLELAGRLGLADTFPPLSVVREVNDKRYSHMLEQRLGIALPYSGIIASLEQLKDAVEGCPFDWVLKHPLGFSALERVVGKRGKISHSGLGWARKRLEKGWTLVFEPWVERTRNFSMHFEIDNGAEIRFLGHCQLLTDLGGVYRGNRVTPSPLDPTAKQLGLEVTRELASSGYWGLVGIDAMTGVLGMEPVLRHLVEINARCSFGRLALALGDWVPQGWSYLWWHPRRADVGKIDRALAPLGEPSVGGVEPGAYSLPLSVDPEQKSATAVLIAPTPLALQELEASRFGLGPIEVPV